MSYPKSWYPLCRSAQLKVGTVRACHAFGKKYAVFRNQRGEIGILESRCCHIGADLSNGFVENDCLVCPLHHWSFDIHGVCTNIPCTDKIPVNAGQHALCCQEHYGVVYAYLGTKPEFVLPIFPDINSAVCSNVRIIEINSCYEMAAANSFDEQHLATVHDRTVIGKQRVGSDSPFHFYVEYEARVGSKTLYDKFLHTVGVHEVHMRLDCWGGNLLLFTHKGTGNNMIISLVPVSGTESLAYIATVVSGDRGGLLVFKKLQATLLNYFTMLFVKQDVKALQGMDFKLGNMLAVEDSTMLQWYRYWRKLPIHTQSFDAEKKSAEKQAPVFAPLPLTDEQMYADCSDDG